MIKKVSSRKKKELVKAIKNPNRYFKLDFGRYGGEVAMGEIFDGNKISKVIVISK